MAVTCTCGARGGAGVDRTRVTFGRCASVPPGAAPGSNVALYGRPPSNGRTGVNRTAPSAMVYSPEIASAPGASSGATDTRKSGVQPTCAAREAAVGSARKSARDRPLRTTAGFIGFERSREISGEDVALHAAEAAHSATTIRALPIRGA